MSEDPRAFIDGPPTESMVEEMESPMGRICPSAGRWVEGREELARLAYQSGYDQAIIDVRYPKKGKQ